MKLLRDQVVVQPDEEENTTPSGIVLTTPTQSQFATGTVVQVGEYGSLQNSTERPSSVQTGDRVVYRRFQAEPLDVNGQSDGLRLTSQNAIVGILDNEPVLTTD